jgi:hypothetical protein
MTANLKLLGWAAVGCLKLAGLALACGVKAAGWTLLAIAFPASVATLAVLGGLLVNG